MRAIQRFKLVGDAIVSCVSGGELERPDIEQMMDLHRSQTAKRAVVWSLGNTTLSPGLRKEMADAMGEHPNFVIVESTIARGVITAMSWLGAKLTSSSPDKIEENLRKWLPAGVNTNANDILQTLHALRREVETELSSPKASAK